MIKYLELALSQEVYEYLEELDEMNWSAWGNVLNQYLRNTSIGTTVMSRHTGRDLATRRDFLVLESYLQARGPPGICPVSPTGQSTVPLETTMAKAGTVPFSCYQTSLSIQEVVLRATGTEHRKWATHNIAAKSNNRSRQ
jgi:hypothetical protein